jgi:hypothetical protein
VLSRSELPVGLRQRRFAGTVPDAIPRDSLTGPTVSAPRSRGSCPLSYSTARTFATTAGRELSGGNRLAARIERTA